MLYLPRHRLRPDLTPDEHAYFHVVSRIVDRRYIFGDTQKSQFLDYLRRYERFCRVQVVGYCLMDDHFHLVVSVPGRPFARPSQQDLLIHVRQTLGQAIHDQYQDRIDFWTHQIQIAAERDRAVAHVTSPLDDILPQTSDLAAYAQAQLEKVSSDIWRRMYDLSQFVFSLKQQFSHWYNKQTNRVGTLWEERFRATLVQPGPAVAEVVAYIDLNPVRAGLVSDPKDYPWSQYGAVMKGDLAALQAITSLSEKPGWLGSSSASGSSVRDDLGGPLPVGRLELPLLLMRILLARRSGGDCEEEARRLAAQGYRFPARKAQEVSYVTGPIRSFVRGLALGDAAYLNGVFERNRDQFGPRRRQGAKRILLENLPEVESSLETATTAYSPPIPKRKRFRSHDLLTLRQAKPHTRPTQ